ncbi:MAG: haloacid dehalogenase-like hydrolase [Myxococcales bacterium]|nr:haloacid dehalogenase-like hydrolase [Myxococcales bacterium]
MTAARVGAFFDIDHTVLEVNSGTKWVGYQWRNRRMSPWEVLRAIYWTVQYRFGLLDFDAMARRVIAQYEGLEVAPFEDEVERWFREEIAATICTEAREHIAAHRTEGHALVLLTSATRFLSVPVGRALDIEHVLCTEVEERDGRFTGTHCLPACYGPGKVARAEAFAADMASTLSPMFRVGTWRDTNSPLLIGLRQIRVTLSLVLGLMVVVAASSLIASLLLIVRRKRHDIAVMMAVGGARSLVFWVFEAVGLLAGLIGAGLGLGLGALYCLVIDTFHYPLGSDIYPVDHLPVLIRAIDALGPAAAAVALCGLASGPVAMMAARVHVIGSLRR